MCSVVQHLLQGPGPLALTSASSRLFSIIRSHDGCGFSFLLHAPFFCLFCLFLSDAKCYEGYFWVYSRYFLRFLVMDLQALLFHSTLLLLGLLFRLVRWGHSAESRASGFCSAARLPCTSRHEPAVLCCPPLSVPGRENACGALDGRRCVLVWDLAGSRARCGLLAPPPASRPLCPVKEGAVPP